MPVLADGAEEAETAAPEASEAARLSMLILNRHCFSAEPTLDANGDPFGRLRLTRVWEVARGAAILQQALLSPITLTLTEAEERGVAGLVGGEAGGGLGDARGAVLDVRGEVAAERVEEADDLPMAGRLGDGEGGLEVPVLGRDCSLLAEPRETKTSTVD